jgi:1-acyl-sn-glycerol-3-phosphate acyltransferase
MTAATRALGAPTGLYERTWGNVLLVWCLVLLGGGLLAWTPVAALLRLVLPRPTGTRVGRAVAHRFFAFYVASLRATRNMRIDDSALAAIAREPGVIVAANHPCRLDALLLLGRLENAVPLMKSTLERSVFWGAPAHLAGYISNRSITQSVRRARDELAAGAQLVIFPEGTRTDPFPLGELRGAVAIIAQRAQAPVQTVIIETDSLFLAKGWPLWRVPPLPITVRVRLGRRFPPPADAAAFMRELRSHFEHELARAELVPPRPA